MSMESSIGPEALGEKQPNEKIVKSEKALDNYLKNDPSSPVELLGRLERRKAKKELLNAIEEDVSDLIETNEVFRGAVESGEIGRDTAKKMIVGEITKQRTVSEEEKQNFYGLLGQMLPEKEKAAGNTVSYENPDGYPLERFSPPTESSLFPRSSQLRFEKLDFQPPG